MLDYNRKVSGYCYNIHHITDVKSNPHLKCGLNGCMCPCHSDKSISLHNITLLNIKYWEKTIKKANDSRAKLINLMSYLGDKGHYWYSNPDHHSINDDLYKGVLSMADYYSDDVADWYNINGN